MIKKVNNLIKQIKIIIQINSSLKEKIDSSGKIDDYYYIKLKNGKIFIDFKSPYYLKRLHFLLNKKLKKNVSKECMNVLFDLNFRYFGKNNSVKNLKEGKYLDLKNGDIIFEVGAFIGFHAIRMSELVGIKGKVIAIEAIPENFELLKMNIEINNIKNIILINKAIWKDRGSLLFNIDEKQKTSALNNIVKTKKKKTLPCDTIDNIYDELKLPKVDFIRIQTNGAEIEALQGMKNILTEKPKLLVAVPYKNRDEVQEMLENYGYQTKFTGHSILAEY